jgi:hypothetical protein
MENASIEAFPQSQANRTLPVGPDSMFAKGSLAVRVEVACDPVPNTPVEGLNENTVIPFWVAAYRNSDLGAFTFIERPHPKKTETKKIGKPALTAAQKPFAPMS